MSYFADHTFAAYGAVASSVGLLALLSGQRALIVLVAILFVDWVAWNVTLATWGFGRAPLLLPTEDAMFLGFAILLNRRFLHDGAVRMVAYLFLVAIIAWLTFIGTRTQNSYTAYATANLVYLCQCAVVGGAVAWRLVADRVANSRRGCGLLAGRGSGPAVLHDGRPKASG